MLFFGAAVAYEIIQFELFCAQTGHQQLLCILSVPVFIAKQCAWH